jgi:hypothetical protein
MYEICPDVRHVQETVPLGTDVDEGPKLLHVAHFACVLVGIRVQGVGSRGFRV